MKQNRFRKWFCLFLACILLALCCVPAFAEGEESGAAGAYAQLKDPAGALLAVSKYGDTVNYPENSVEGIVAAANAGADMIYVRVRKTADGYLVLMADENLSRMCVDSLGNVADKNVADVGYHELSDYHLRNRTGNLHEQITACTVPTLTEAIESLSGKALLLVDGAWAFRDEIYDLLNENNALNSVVLIAEGDKKEVTNFLSSKTTMPLVLSSYSGNVVFSAKSMISKTLSGGAVGTLLASGNPYGVLYGNSVLSEFKKTGRAAIDMTDPTLCGKRTDNFTGWNDVTERGYSIIITNNIAELCAYRERVAVQKERLSAAIEQAQKVDVTLCSADSVNALKEAINGAQEALTSSASENSLMEANYTLRLALEGLTNRTEDGDSKSTVTTGRIVTAVLVVVALIILEIILESVRRKKMQKRKKQRDRRKNAEGERNTNPHNGNTGN